MPDEDWYSETSYPLDHVARKARRRSQGTIDRIMDKPTDITILRDGAFIAVQTVRIEARGFTQRNSTRDNTNSVTNFRGITVFGVRGHPRIPDLDIQVDDKFGYNGDTYIVMGVTYHAGETQAAAERYQP